MYQFISLPMVIESFVFGSKDSDLRSHICDSAGKAKLVSYIEEKPPPGRVLLYSTLLIISVIVPYHLPGKMMR